MDFRLLGPLVVFDGPAPLPIAAGKQRALLAVLLLHANRTVGREQLVDALWGEEVPESAQKMVQIHVSQLRKALPEARLLTRAPGYLLEAADDEIDLARFERSVARARRALSSGQAEQARALLGDALALWRGRALAEFSEPFARARGRASRGAADRCARMADRGGPGARASPRRRERARGADRRVSAARATPLAAHATPSIGPAGTRRRSRATRRFGGRSRTSSGWSRRLRCANSSAGCSGRMRRSTWRSPRARAA